MSDVKQWNRNPIDLLILLVYLGFFSLGMHVAGSLRRNRYDAVPLVDKLLNPFHYVMALLITVIFLSPFTFYFKKVPKKLIIDAGNRKLHLQKKRRSKPLNFDLNHITFHSESTRFFSILEFYSEVTTSRGITMNRRFTSIVVPAFGFSWNKKIIREITDQLTELHVQEEEKPQKRTIWEHIYN